MTNDAGYMAPGRRKKPGIRNTSPAGSQLRLAEEKCPDFVSLNNKRAVYGIYLKDISELGFRQSE